ncbi:hypothetical protein ACOME3_003525 [Neoechinorhynchus agilis]
MIVLYKNSTSIKFALVNDWSLLSRNCNEIDNYGLAPADVAFNTTVLKIVKLRDGTKKINFNVPWNHEFTIVSGPLGYILHKRVQVGSLP